MTWHRVERFVAKRFYGFQSLWGLAGCRDMPSFTMLFSAFVLCRQEFAGKRPMEGF